LAVVLGHFGAANRGQLPPSPHGSSRVNASSAADHALSVGAASIATRLVANQQGGSHLAGAIVK
jgi:hypothetical protein